MGIKINNKEVKKIEIGGKEVKKITINGKTSWLEQPDVIEIFFKDFVKKGNLFENQYVKIKNSFLLTSDALNTSISNQELTTNAPYNNNFYVKGSYTPWQQYTEIETEVLTIKNGAKLINDGWTIKLTSQGFGGKFARFSGGGKSIKNIFDSLVILSNASFEMDHIFTTIPNGEFKAKQFSSPEKGSYTAFGVNDDLVIKMRCGTFNTSGNNGLSMYGNTEPTTGENPTSIKIEFTKP